MIKYLYTRVILFIWVVVATVVRSQNIDKLTPQVLSTTILIDRNTDLTNLKEQLIRASKNADIKEAKTFWAYHDAFEIVKDSLSIGKIFISNKYIAMPFGRDSLKIVFDNNENTLAKELLKVLGFYQEKIGALDIDGDVSDQLERLVSLVETRIKKHNELIPKSLNPSIGEIEKILNKTKDIKERKIVFLKYFTNLCTYLVAQETNINFIPEAERIAATGTIVNTFRELVLKSKISLLGDSLVLEINKGTACVIMLNGKKMTIDSLAMEFLMNYSKIVRNDLEEHYGLEHASVKYFDIFFPKLINGIKTLQEQAERKLPLLNESVTNIIYDYNNIKSVAESLRNLKLSNMNQICQDTGNIFKALDRIEALEFKTDFLVRNQQIISKLQVGRLKELIKKTCDTKEQLEYAKSEIELLKKDICEAPKLMLKDLILNPIMDYITNTLIPRYNKGMESDSRFSWINNFSIATSGEYSTTVNYSIVDTKNMRWEVSANFYLNSNNTDTSFNKSIKDSATITRNLNFNTSFKYSPEFWNNNFEMGVYASTMTRGIPDLNQIFKKEGAGGLIDTLRNDSIRHNINLSNIGGGLYLALRRPKILGMIPSPVVWRVFWESKFNAFYLKNDDLHNLDIPPNKKPKSAPRVFTWGYITGIEARFVEGRYISSVFLVYKSKDLTDNDTFKNGLSIGITLPIIK